MDSASVKEGNGDSSGSIHRQGCSRDILIGIEEQVSVGSMVWGSDEEVPIEEDELEEDLEELNLSDDFKDAPRLVLSKQERELRRPWSQALIIKLMGKSLLYNFFCGVIVSSMENSG